MAGHDIGHSVVTWMKLPYREFAKLLNWLFLCLGGATKLVMFAFRCLDVASTSEPVWKPNIFRAGYVDVVLPLRPQFASGKLFQNTWVVAAQVHATCMDKYSYVRGFWLRK